MVQTTFRIGVEIYSTDEPLVFNDGNGLGHMLLCCLLPPIYVCRFLFVFVPSVHLPGFLRAMICPDLIMVDLMRRSSLRF